MTQYFFQLGAFPALSQTEVMSILPGFSGKQLEASNILQGKLKDSLMLEKHSAQQKFTEFGGSLRCGVVLGAAKNTREIEAVITERLQQQYAIAQKKICFAITFPQQERLLKTLLIGVKKNCQKTDISMRFVNRDFRNLDAGTFWKEQLDAEENSEFFLWQDGQEIYVGETYAAQDVEAFAERDYGKPVRDMQIGMLPPKLALMMLNFSRENGELPQQIWDPFCGTGTVLIEAARLGVTCFGSDFNPDMVAASQKNMQHFFSDFKDEHVFQHDVTKPFPNTPADTIVTEGYLGPICSNPISQQEFRKIEQQVEPVYEGFLQNITKLDNIRKMLLVFPFWRQQGSGFFGLQNILDQAHSFGYTVRDFQAGSTRGSLGFIRKNQVVGREIFQLEK